MSIVQRAAMLQPWVDIAATFLAEGKPDQAERILRTGMTFVGQVTS